MKASLDSYTDGARLATDLVNTSARVRTAGDVLADPDALARFLAEHDLEPAALAGGRSPGHDDLEQVRQLREDVRAAIEPGTEEQGIADATALAARAAGTPGLHRDRAGRWQWHLTTSPQASLADELAVTIGMGLLGTLQALNHDRFRRCASPVCDGLFVDTSKSGRRRYCMPEVCGNRLNVANHRARQRAHASGGRGRG
ncbi:putative RNA-binding Zn ribbon-like protein [Haloactinopolyspora alba]|uniref:Putative RNA-binding Zn ribbon-like protein n=1 Tax=Haloactinopolyspora alba TaxID=648780 RepID=A0A2P8DVP2_9ACTN|nr:CGNR zinc finger domain-containing protein [Haloactinopolyspora alba]PSL01303.1 putative RNA-binding Zn ribbon-like protein [Haloactinopolyspora alba]